MAESVGHSWAADKMALEVERLLQATPAYGRLDEPTRQSLKDSLTAVTRALAAGDPHPVEAALASVADLRGRISQPGGQSGGGGTDSSSQPPTSTSTPAQPASTPEAPPTPSPSGAG